MDKREQVISFVKERYRTGEQAPSIRQILRELDMNRKQLYGLFPKGLKEICSLASVTIPQERFERVRRPLQIAKRSGNTGERGERAAMISEFELMVRASKLRAGVEVLKKEFEAKTEGVKDDPYWSAQRERFKSLCDWTARKMETTEDVETLEEAQEVLKRLGKEYTNQTGDLPYHDKMEQGRTALTTLKQAFGGNIEEAISVAKDVTMLKSTYGMRVEQMGQVYTFVDDAISRGWHLDKLVDYVTEHHNLLAEIPVLQSDVRNLDERKARLTNGIEGLQVEERVAKARVNDLLEAEDKLLTDVQSIMESRDSVERVLDRKSRQLEVVAWEEQGAGVVYRVGVEGLSDAILNDSTLLLMAIANPNAVEQFRDVVLKHSNTLKGKEAFVTVLGRICTLIQAQEARATKEESRPIEESQIIYTNRVVKTPCREIYKRESRT